MSVNREEKLGAILKVLNASSGVEGSAIVSKDGLLISVSLAGGVDAENFAARSATMVGAAETAIGELSREDGWERVIVESKRRKIVASGAGSSALLVVLAGPKANLGLVLVRMDKAAKQIDGELGKDIWQGSSSACNCPA